MPILAAPLFGVHKTRTFQFLSAATGAANDGETKTTNVQGQFYGDPTPVPEPSLMALLGRDRSVSPDAAIYDSESGMTDSTTPAAIQPMTTKRVEPISDEDLQTDEVSILLNYLAADLSA